MPHFPERNAGSVCYFTPLYAPLPRARFRRTSRQCNLYSQKRLWRNKNLKAVQFVPPKRFWRNKNLKAVQFLHLYTPHFPERNSGKVCYVTILYAPLPLARFRRTSRHCIIYSQKPSIDRCRILFKPFLIRYWQSKSLF